MTGDRAPGSRRAAGRAPAGQARAGLAGRAPAGRAPAGRLAGRAPEGRLAGRGVIVTGATGIAAASVERFALEGASVFVISRTGEHCRELVERVRASGGDAAWATADLTDEDQAERAFGAAVEHLRRVDGLFNVAGGSGRRFGDAAIHEMTAEGWDRTFALNARTHMLTCRAGVRQMLRQDPDADGSRGAICNMASILASHPSPAAFPTHAYASTKGAIVSLTLGMAAYYARSGIRVNAVAPALTTSRMSVRAAGDPATQALSRARQPLAGGFLPPDDVASAALFFLSPDSRYVTGQVLIVDGGWSVTDVPVEA